MRDRPILELGDVANTAVAATDVANTAVANTAVANTDAANTDTDAANTAAVHTSRAIRYATVLIRPNREWYERVFDIFSNNPERPRANSDFVVALGLTSKSPNGNRFFSAAEICDDEHEYLVMLSYLKHTPIYETRVPEKIHILGTSCVCTYRHPTRNGRQYVYNPFPIFSGYFEQNQQAFKRVAQTSQFNVIYDCRSVASFAIVKISTTRDSERYLVAYDPRVLDDTVVPYVLKRIFYD